MAVETIDFLVGHPETRCEYDAFDEFMLVEDAFCQEIFIEVAFAGELWRLKNPFILLGEGEHPKPTRSGVATKDVGIDRQALFHMEGKLVLAEVHKQDGVSPIAIGKLISLDVVLNLPV